MQKYVDLKKWMQDNKIVLNDKVTIKSSKLGGFGVFASQKIPANSILLSVPKDAVLCPVNSGIANLLDENGLEDMIGLTLAYMFEKSRGKSSPWYTFIQSMDGPDVSLPRLWDEEDKRLFKGTEIEFMGGLDASEILDGYEDIVKPFIESNNDLLQFDSYFSSLECYTESLILVCSRAFEVDIYRRLSLVPGACLFNHSDSETVHFESTAIVCIDCGALYCEHQVSDEDEDYDEEEEEEVLEGDSDVEGEEEEEEEENGEAQLKSEIEEEEEEDSCDIRTLRSIKAGEEIFNSYGDYSNGVLLARYGFAIWDNKHETVGLVRQVKDYAKKNKLMSRLNWFKKHFYFCSFAITPEEWDERSFAENGDEDPEIDNYPPPTIDWQDVIAIQNNGEPLVGLQVLASIFAMSDKVFFAYQININRGRYVPCKLTPQSKLLIQRWVAQRLQRYAYEYDNAIKRDSKQSRHKELADITVGTEQLLLKRALECLN